MEGGDTRADFGGRGPDNMVRPRKADRTATLAGVLTEYADHTTMHGVWRVSQGSYNTLRRTIWTLALCLGMTVLLYVFIEQVRVYLEFRVQTVLSVQDQPSLEFPSVTVCNYNQFRKTPTLAAGNTGQMLRELFAVKNYVGKIQRDAPPAEELAPDTNLTLTLIGLAHTLDKMVMSADWLGKMVNKEEYFSMSMTEVGVCYTFNSIESQKRHSPLYVHDAGTDSGLTLLMDIENDEYYYGEGTSAGIRVLIHDPREVPMVGQYGFSVAPGTATLTAIQLTEEIFAKDPYTDCVDPDDQSFQNPLHFYDPYTQTGCKMESIVHYVYSVCKCKQYYNPANYSQNAVRALRQKCPPLCKSSTYNSKLSYATFPAQHIVDELVLTFNKTEQGLRKNVLQLKIYFSDLAIHEIQHRPAYTGVSLFADVGGQMGLCIGASVLTLVELIDLAFIVFWRGISNNVHH